MKHCYSDKSNGAICELKDWVVARSNLQPKQSWTEVIQGPVVKSCKPAEAWLLTYILSTFQINYLLMITV